MKFSMVIANPMEITALVRQKWAELVSGVGARETTRDAPVMRAMASAFHQVSHGQCDFTSAVIEAIRGTDEWAHVHKDTIASMFKSMTGRLPSDEETTLLWDSHNTDELAERISDMQVDTDCLSAEDDASRANMVDEDWMAEFERCYGRDSSVYEYVRLRPMNLDINTCATTHNECFHAMREVYRQYFDKALEERDFVKWYVPDVLTSGLTLVKDERNKALCTDTYCDAMLSRLSQLYAIMSGDKLSEKEVAHLFRERVKGKELPLDTEELNTIVAEYVSVGESLCAEIQDIFRAYLSRDAHYDETDAWLPRFRMEGGAHAALKRQLSSSHEFHSVIIDIVSECNTHMSRRDKFRILGEILSKHASELENLASADDIRALVAPICNDEA